LGTLSRAPVSWKATSALALAAAQLLGGRLKEERRLLLS
jgi:hypothetical protein